MWSIIFNRMEVDAIALHRFSESNFTAADQDYDGVGNSLVHQKKIQLKSLRKA
jgi:hypothetical protein